MPVLSKPVTPSDFALQPHRKDIPTVLAASTASNTLSLSQMWDAMKYLWSLIKCLWAGVLSSYSCIKDCYALYQNKDKDPQAWEAEKKKCAVVVLYTIIGIAIVVAVIGYFLSGEVSSAGSLLEDFRLIINTVLNKIKAALKPFIDLAKWAFTQLWQLSTYLASSTGTSPMLWHVNILTLLAWSGLMVINESEMLLDEFYSSNYGRLVHEVYTALAYPENWVIGEAKKYGGLLLELIVAPLMTPFKIGAFIFALPIAFFWGPIKVLLSGIVDVVDEAEEEADKYNFHPYDKQSGSENSLSKNDMVLPQAYPNKVCPAECDE